MLRRIRGLAYGQPAVQVRLPANVSGHALNGDWYISDSAIAVRLAERGDVASLLNVLPQITSRPNSLSATTLRMDEPTRMSETIFLAS